jgi:hypothetical protein
MLALLLSLLLSLSSCIVGREVNITGDTITEEIFESSPVAGDSISAVMKGFNLRPGALDTLVQYQDYLYEIRQQSFEYPRKGGGAYIIKYYEGNVIYASIVGPNNTTLEDIVFFKEIWYYNQNKINETITKRQAEIFVENIYKMIQNEENADLDVPPDSSLNN